MKLARADHLLALLLKGRVDYRCCEQPGRWIARCPICSKYTLDTETFDLTITEHGHRGRVSVRCKHGCDPEEILHVLKHPDRCYQCGAVHGQAEHLSRAATDLLKIAHEQQHLLRQLLADEDVDALELVA